MDQHKLSDQKQFEFKLVHGSCYLTIQFCFFQLSKDNYNTRLFALFTGGTTFVTCSLGNPYETDSKDTIAIQLDASQLDLNTELVSILSTDR